MNLPSLNSGLIWNLSYGAESVLLEVLATLPSDFNSDGVIDANDLPFWESSYGVDADADTDDDGDTDGRDFVAWQRQLGQTPAGGTTLAAVPEPFSLSFVILAAGLLCLSRTGCWPATR